MSRDKNTSKRMYSVRGAATKRKLRNVRAKSSSDSHSGYKWITFCPECERPEPTAIGSETKFADCKKGHSWNVV